MTIKVRCDACGHDPAAKGLDCECRCHRVARPNLGRVARIVEPKFKEKD